MAVSQPLILLLINYLRNKKIDKGTVLNTIPFFTIAAVSAAITFLTQKSTVGMESLPLYSIFQRIGIPFYGIAFYIVKTVLPLRLSAFYPLPVQGDTQMNMLLLLAPILVIGAGVAVFFTRRSTRKVIFGALFFLFTLVPMLQMMPVGSAMVADRFTYIPAIGLYFILPRVLPLCSGPDCATASVPGRLFMPGLDRSCLFSAGPPSKGAPYGKTAFRCGTMCWLNNHAGWDITIEEPLIATSGIMTMPSKTFHGKFRIVMRTGGQCITGDFRTLKRETWTTHLKISMLSFRSTHSMHRRIITGEWCIM